MPLKLQILSTEGAKWQSWCEHRLVALSLHREFLNRERTPESRVRIIQQNYELPNRVRATVISWDDCDIIRIEGGGLAGVIFHPRSGVINQLPYTEYLVDSLGVQYLVAESHSGVIGGWKNGNELLTTEYLFPLDDTDNASFLLTDKANDIFTGGFAGSGSLYGNLYWVNGATNEGVVSLSWRGTPTRHFRLPSNINITGFSNIDEINTTGLDDVYTYTSFGTILYQGGQNLADSPRYNWPNGGMDRCQILGVMQNTVGTIYLACLSNRRNAPEGIANPGYFLMLWKTSDGKEEIRVDGWGLVAERQYPSNGLPWFGNATGTEFICSNGDRLTTDGIFTLGGIYNGDYSESGIGPRLNIHADYVGNDYFEYKELDAISSSVNALFSAETVITVTESTEGLKSGTYIPVVGTDPGSPEPFEITGPEAWSGNLDDYTIISGPYIPNGVLQRYPPTETCGMGTVRFTLSCPDGSNTQTATFAVRMPTGQWEVESDVTYGSGGTHVTQISGDTTTEEWISYGCNLNAICTGGYVNKCAWVVNAFECWTFTRCLSYSCDPAYPTPTVTLPSDMAASIASGQASCGTTYEDISRCINGTELPPPDDGGCNDYLGHGQTPDTLITARIYCVEVRRRIISKYVC